ncbi:MAG: hypothetical protein LBJ37_18495 [Paucimonas sp.]|jgi:hemolysin activation/secretion protein|nr:hypothetical protein [Paucimonas sp.]
MFAAPIFLGVRPVQADPALQQLREQQRERRVLERQQRLRQLSRPPVNLPAEPTAPTMQSDHCWPISGLRLAGNTLITRETLNAHLDPLLQSCMGEAQINEVLKAITRLYVHEGYLASRPYLANPPEAGASLDIMIVEGFVESVEFADPDLPLSLERAFPDLLGRPLALDALEQGLSQMNRLQSFDLSADLEPGTLQGGTRVVIRSKRRRASRWQLMTHLNNTGAALTGRNQAAIDLILDSPLEQNDRLHLRGRRTLPSAPGESLSFGLGYSIPHGAWSFALNADYPNYRAPLPGVSLNSTGQSAIYSLGLERSLWNKRSSALGASLQLNYKRLDNRIGNRTVILQSPTLTTLDAGLNLSWRDDALWSINLGYSLGLPFLGADTQTFNSRTPQPQFRKYRASLWQRREGLDPALPWRWDSDLVVQYSPDPLPAVEQISVGDSVVRGQGDYTMTGASGARWRNNLSLALATPLPIQVRPSIGLDLGWSRFDHGLPSQRLAGAFAGIQLATPRGQLNLDYQRTLYVSHLSSRLLEPGQWRARLTLLF